MDIYKAKNLREYLQALDTEEEHERHAELTRLEQRAVHPNVKAMARHTLINQFGEGDYVYGQDEGIDPKK